MIAVGDTLKPHSADKYETLHIKLEDTRDADIKKYFDECNKFIANGITVVYCVNGVSRSAAIIAAHLMLTYKIKTNDAIKKIKSVRPIVQIEDNFHKQLIKLECEMDKLTQ